MFRIRFTNLGDDFAKTTQLSRSRIVVFHMTKLRQLPKANMEGGIQQLRGQNFAIFAPPPACVDSFYTLSVDRHFLTTSPLPPHLVHVVIEWPLS